MSNRNRIKVKYAELCKINNEISKITVISNYSTCQIVHILNTNDFHRYKHLYGQRSVVAREYINLIDR